jgi:hypothetical protein
MWAASQKNAASWPGALTLVKQITYGQSSTEHRGIYRCLVAKRDYAVAKLASLAHRVPS